MGRSEINHPKYGRMVTVPLAAEYLQISRSELKRRLRAGRDQLESWQERPRCWQYVSVASLEAAVKRRFAGAESGSPE